MGSGVEGRGHVSQESRPQGRPSHRMVDRVASILECVARAPEGLTLTEVAAQIGAPVSSTQGLINGLVANGYLDEADRVYRLGPAPLLLNLLAGRHLPGRVSHSDLEEIHRETGLTTLLSIVVGRDVFYIDYVSSNPRYAYLAENHVRRSLLRTSAGWVLLAGFEKRDLWAFFRALPEEDSERIGRFLAELPRIQESGLATAPMVAEISADGISIAVTEESRTVAAVGVVADPATIEEQRDHIVDVLQRQRRKWESGPSHQELRRRPGARSSSMTSTHPGRQSSAPSAPDGIPAPATDVP